MALNYILLEDGSGHILLEDGSGSILLENQPASSSIVFTPTGNMRAYARTTGSTSITFTVTSTALHSYMNMRGNTGVTFTVLGDLCYSIRPFDPVTGISTSPTLSNSTGLGSLPAQVSTVVPPPPYSINIGGYETIFGTSTSISPNPPFPENQNC